MTGRAVSVSLSPATAAIARELGRGRCPFVAPFRAIPLAMRHDGMTDEVRIGLSNPRKGPMLRAHTSGRAAR